MKENIAIEVKNLSKIYKGQNKYALENISFKIKSGIIFGLLGPNGAGKSTFINLFCGLLDNSEGKIEINNKGIQELISSWHKVIGYVPQSASIIDESILFNISLESDQDKTNLEKNISNTKLGNWNLEKQIPLPICFQ